MTQQLENKKIVIVGGTSGIGFSAMQAFIKNGAQVVAMGLDIECLPVTKNCNYISGDARVEGAVEKAIELCVSKFGKFDGLMHVAGGSGRKWGDDALHKLTLAGWQKTLDLNLTSVMLSNRAAIKYFLKNEAGGSILNTGTVLAAHPSPKYFYTHAYAASKAAITGFSKSIAAYYASFNIRINVIAPALTNTPMSERAVNRKDIVSFIKSKQPLDGGRIGRPSDIDEAACYFMSEGSKFTTGQVLNIDGGWSVSEGQYPDL